MATVNRAVNGEVKHKRRRPNWTDDETRCLITIWEDHVLDLKKLKRNGLVYANIANQLAELGYSRSKEEVQTRLSNLGHDYRKEKSKLNARHPISTWKFYNDVHTVLGSLPDDSSQLKESDSQMTNLEDESQARLLDLSSEQRVPIMEDPTEVNVGLVTYTEAASNSNITETEDSSLSSSNNLRQRLIQRKKSYSETFQEKLLSKIIAANRKAEEYEKQTIELQKVQLALQERSILLESELINAFKDMLDEYEQKPSKKQKTVDQEGQTSELLKQQLSLQHKSIALQEELLNVLKEFTQKQS